MPLYREETSGGSGADASGSFVLATPTGSLPLSRTLTAGSNITITDNGPGSTIVITSAASGTNIPPTALGQVLFASSASLARFNPSLPITTRNGWLRNSSGLMLVSGSYA
jgi:hypothetical protein